MGGFRVHGSAILVEEVFVRHADFTRDNIEVDLTVDVDRGLVRPYPLRAKRSPGRKSFAFRFKVRAMEFCC